MDKQVRFSIHNFPKLLNSISTFSYCNYAELLRASGLTSIQAIEKMGDDMCTHILSEEDYIMFVLKWGN